MSTDPRHDEARDQGDDAEPVTSDEAPGAAAGEEVSPGPLPGPAPAEGTGSTGNSWSEPGDAEPTTAMSSSSERPDVDRSATDAEADPGAHSTGDAGSGNGDYTGRSTEDEATMAVPAASPTRDDDAALREERERRFGRFGRSRDADKEPAEGEVRTTALPAPGATAPARTGRAPAATDDARHSRTEINEEDPFQDWDDPPRSRAQAHWWVVLITLVFTPPAWYLIADGGERWTNAREVAPDAIHFGALVEIAGGLLLLAVVLIGARWSSVGPIIMGSIATLIGGAFLAIPQMVEDFLAEYSDIFTRLGQFGQNVYDHLLTDGNTGRILAYGVVLILAGVISHGARRQGRREERRRAAVEAL
ncbi:hypothetical protein [Pseudactinotalea sp. Z1732]|uniref:hypothetical protein n=1 Tax=Pseudactinotalea sp. Z1732 TaxID=3413026 RepID=UPI003C7983F7